jgi:cytochrome c oxidase subunit 2
VQQRKRRQDWHHILIMCLIMLALAAGLAFLFSHIDFVPSPSSVERDYIDHFLQVLFSIAGVFFAAVIVVVGYSLIFFRRRPGDETEGTPMKGSRPLEEAWTIIPLIIVIALGTYGGFVLNRMTAPGPPQTEMEIDVLAFRFGWQFTYPDYNVTSYELHAPVNQRILIKLKSKDVVHSFWVQEWGPKQDAVPGMTTQVRYTPTKMGQYTVQCSQLCGFGHTYMTAPALVTSVADFQRWIEQQQQKPPPTPTAPSPTTSPGPSFGVLAQEGKTIFANVCATCHGDAGQGKIGPALIGANQHLVKYQTGQGLLDFISTNMPLGKPGSLTRQQYLDLLAFLMVQNHDVAEGVIFNESELNSMGLR